MPVAMPVVMPTVAIAVLLLAQVPPLMVLAKVVVAPGQTVDEPIMLDGAGITVSIRIA
jgi:hypothetical protein